MAFEEKRVPTGGNKGSIAAFVLAAVAVGLSVKMNAANTKVAQLVSANEALSSQLNTAQSNLSDANAKVAKDESDMAATKKQLTDLQAQLTTAQGMLTSTQKEAADAQEKIRIESMPQVTVIGGFTTVNAGEGESGDYFHFVNTSATADEFTLKVTRPSTGATRTFPFTLNSAQSGRIGERDGWAFLHGDQIEVSQPLHKHMFFVDN